MDIEVQHIAITMPDGSLQIMQIVIAAPLRCFSPKEAILAGFVVERADDGEEFWSGGITDYGVSLELARSGYDRCKWRRIDAEELPTDRLFRDAWADIDGSVTVHMPTAVEIHKARLRRIREPQFASLDVQYMRADETGDTKKKAEIAGRKQALRDATDEPRIASAETPEELADAVPEVLRGAKRRGYPRGWLPDLRKF